MLLSCHGSILVGPVTHQFQGWALCGCRAPAPVLYLGRGVRLLVQNSLPVKASLPLEPRCRGLGKHPSQSAPLAVAGWKHAGDTTLNHASLEVHQKVWAFGGQ